MGKGVGEFFRKAASVSALLGTFAATPFAALTLALIAGILAGRFSQGNWMYLVCAAVAVFGAVRWILPGKVSALTRRLKRANMLWLIVLPITVMLGTAVIRMAAPTEEAGKFPYARGTVLEAVTGEKGDRLLVEISGELDDFGRQYSVKPYKALVYTQITVNPGDIVLFRSYPQLTFETSESEAYVERMYARGVDFSVSTIGEKTAIVGKDNTLKYRLLRARDELVTFIDGTHLSPDTRAFYSALLTGDRQALDPQIRREFSAAGIAHILALSGLHVGVILLILGWVFKWLNLLNMRIARYLLMCIGLVLFAMFTGMSPSVVRAVVMGCCVLLGLAQQRPNSALNSLSFAAFLILVFDPRALFDLGFRLSFICTFGLVAIGRHLVPSPDRRHYRLVKLAQWVIIPVVAFVVTWPFTVQTFGTVSLLFLPLNLLIVPLLPLVMIIGIAYLALAATGWDPGWMTSLVDTVFEWLRWCASTVAAREESAIEVTLHPAVPWLYLGALALLGYWLSTRSRRAFALSAIGFATAIYVILFVPPEIEADQVTIPANYDSCEVSHRHKGRVTAFTLRDGTIDLRTLNGATTVYLDRSLPKKQELPDSLAYFATEPYRCRELIIGPNFKGSAQVILTYFQPSIVLLSPRLYPNVSEALTDSLTRLSIPVHDLSAAPYIRPK